MKKFTKSLLNIDYLGIRLTVHEGMANALHAELVFTFRHLHHVQQKNVRVIQAERNR